MVVIGDGDLDEECVNVDNEYAIKVWKFWKMAVSFRIYKENSSNILSH